MQAAIRIQLCSGGQHDEASDASREQGVVEVKVGTTGETAVERGAKRSSKEVRKDRSRRLSVTGPEAYKGSDGWSVRVAQG